MLRYHRPTARTLRGAVAVVALLVVVAVSTPTLAAFTGVISGNGRATASSLVLTSTPAGGSTCTSTGGTGQFSSDSAACAGSVWPAQQLSGVAGTPESLATTFSSIGGSAPSSASAAIGSPGLEMAADASGGGDGAFAMGGVGFGTSGPLSASATSFNGSTGMLETSGLINDPGPSYTLAGWFKVANGYSSGGGIIGFQGAQNGVPPEGWDRKLWMDDSGHIAAGEFTGAGVIATSSSTYNNGAWHFAVASFSSSAGLVLYVDGAQVATNSAATSPQDYAGYWTIGYQYGLNWSPVPASYYLDGSLAEVAVFPSALTGAQVTTLYDSGSGTEAAFETRVQNDDPSEFWPLQSMTATSELPDVDDLPDISGNNNLGLPQSSVTPSEQGPFGTDGAMYFNGSNSSTSLIETTTDNSALPSAFTMAIWFKAPTGLTDGGGILDFDTYKQSGGLGYDPLLWMDDSGKIVAGTYIGSQVIATSTSTYDNNSWHFAVVTVSSAGLKLYVDGSLVASNASGTTGGASGGYWVVGDGYYTGWTDAPTNRQWTGELAHFAAFTSALTAIQISTLYSEPSVGAYEAGVLADLPTCYWPLTDGGTTESAAYPFFQVEPDSSDSNDDATAVGSAVTLGVPGPFGSSSNAAAFAGGTGWLETAGSVTSPDTFSLVAWFKAPSHSNGGGIIGFDNMQSGGGTDYHDRTIWMDDSGKLVAGISGGSGVEAKSSLTYDNNTWYLVVATFSPSSMTLYVDGSVVASATSGISDSNYSGYWLVGNVADTSWADIPSSSEWDGSLADVAVIPSVLSSTTVGTTLFPEPSQAALASEIESLSPTAFWPLASAATSVTDAGGIEISEQATNNGTTTCAFPAGSGSCPSLSGSDFTPSSSTASFTSPASAHATTLTLTGEEPSAAPSPFAGMDFAVPYALTGSLDGWTAALNSHPATLQL